MIKLSEIQKPKNVVQFSNKKYFIKRFCANGTFIPSEDSFDNGEDNTFFTDEPYLEFDDTEPSTEEINEIEKLIDDMQKYGDSFTKMFALDTKKVIEYKQFAVKIQDYIKEKTLPSRQILIRRLKQVISYINKTSVDKLSQTIVYAIQFLREYIEFFISNSINKGTTSNLGMALGLNRYVPNKSAIRDLQKVLKRVASELASSGTISKMTQTKLQTAYRAMFVSLLEGISTKIKNPMKKELLSSAISGIESSQESENEGEN